MAAVVLGVSTASTSNASSYASGSFTPAANDLLVVFVAKTGSVNNGSMSDSLGGAWTFIQFAQKASSADRLVAFVRNSLASASAMTVTYDCTGDAATGAVITVLRVSGMSNVGAAAVRQNAFQDNQAASTTPAPVFSAACLTGNPTLGCVFNATNPATLTPPTNWTERNDTGYATPTTGSESVSRDSGFTGTTITWGSTSGSAFGSLAVELDASLSISGAGAIGSAEAFGTAKLNLTLLAVGNIASAAAFGSHTVAQAGPQTISGAGAIGTAEIFGSAKVSFTLRNAGAIGSAEAFGTGKLSFTLANVGAIASGQAFGAAKLNFTLGNVGAIGSAEAFGTGKASFTILGAGNIATGESIGAASVTQPGGAQTISAAGAIAGAEAFGTASVTAVSTQVTGRWRPYQWLDPSPVWPPQPSLPKHITGAGVIRSEEWFGIPAVRLGPRPLGVRERELREIPPAY